MAQKITKTHPKKKTILSLLHSNIIPIFYLMIIPSKNINIPQWPSWAPPSSGPGPALSQASWTWLKQGKLGETTGFNMIP